MQRIVSALAVFIIVILILQSKNSLIFLTMAVFMLETGLYEFHSMLKKDGRGSFENTVYAAVFLLILAFYNGIHSIIYTLPFITIPVLLLIGRTINKDLIKLPADARPSSTISASTDDSLRIKIFYTLFALTYIGWLGGHLILLYNINNRPDYIYLTIFIGSMGDTFAYYTGKNFGRRRLAPLISPKKTVEGSIGGLLGSILGVFIINLIFLKTLSPLVCILIGITGGLLGQMGDLFESYIKRVLKQKDSGSIIPGHGGILDRIDSFIFTAPYIYYLVVLIGI